MTPVRFEQAVYGSFPFWSRGYALLGSSPGCLPEWLDAFQAACQKFGEPPAGLPAEIAIFSYPLRPGGRALVGVFPQGSDDRGRPGALAFHGLFLTRRELARAGDHPFALLGALRGDWNAESILPIGESVRAGWKSSPLPLDPEAQRVADAIAGGLRVAVPSVRPIEGLVQRVWERLPARARRRASFATWSYSLASAFDLVGLARPMELAGYRTLADLEAPRPRRSGRRTRIGGGLGALLVVFGLLLLRGRPSAVVHPQTLRDRSPVEVPSAAVLESAPPAPSVSRPMSDSDRAAIHDGLRALAARFGIVAPDDSGPTALMTAIAGDLRYRGPWLSRDQRQRLRADGSARALRSLELDAHLRRFGLDRRMPSDFARGPIDWQLRVLAWSFAYAPHPSLTPPELPFALAESLAVAGPLPFGPLERDYPVLKDYARFLSRLRGR